MQGSVGLQFPSLASRSVGKCQDSRLREKLPGPLPGHTCLAHTEPPRPPRLARQTLMRGCSALDPCTSISWRCLELVAFVVAFCALRPRLHAPVSSARQRLTGPPVAPRPYFMAQTPPPGPWLSIDVQKPGRGSTGPTVSMQCKIDTTRFHPDPAPEPRLLVATHVLVSPILWEIVRGGSGKRKGARTRGGRH